MKHRVYSIDVLRALAIIGMVLSAHIFLSWNKDLPAYLFHAQVPPPDFVFNPSIAGITWVDLVFPFFLFSMGAAIPLSLSRKRESGASIFSIVLSVVKRSALLVIFALVMGNTQMHILKEALGSTVISALLTVAVWLSLFVLFARLPQLSERRVRQMNLLGLGLLVLIMVVYKLLGVELSLYRSDIIILILANVTLFGSLIWLLTHNNIVARLVAIALLVSIKFSSDIDGSWVQTFANYTPAPWLYRMIFLQYLCVVLPGTIVGDMIIKAQQSSDLSKIIERKKSFLSASLLLLANVVAVVWALFAREVALSVVITIASALIVWILIRRANGATEQLLKKLFSTGFLFLILGLILEPLDGGIKKADANLSYMFVTTGMAAYVVMASTVLIHSFKVNMKFLVECGQNPMIAYAAAGYVIVPLLTIVNEFVHIPWIFGGGGIIGALGKGVITTLLMMIFTVAFTRRKIFWRT